jgi:hypothetical protein
MTCQPHGSEQESPSAEIQTPEVPLPSAEIPGPSSSACSLQHQQPKRKDREHIHAIRHAVLSRYRLEALVYVRENARSLRRIERKFRAELKPSGFAAEMLFAETTYMPSDPTSAYPA